MIRNAHPDARVMVAGKKANTDFAKMYHLGDQGPIKRPRVEADQLSKSDKAKPKKTN